MQNNNSYLFDNRSLSLFRILLGSVVMVGLAQRALEFSSFFGSSGVVPSSLPPILLGEWYPALPSQDFLWILIIGLGLLASITAIFGKYITLSSAVLLLIVLLLQARNPFIEYGADRVIRFCLLFLLANSVIQTSKPNIIQRLLQALFIVQIVVIYLIPIYYRQDSSWWQSGTALRIALKLDIFSTALGRSIADYQEFLRVLTPITITYEFLAPLFLVVLWRYWRVRLLVIFSFILFHFGIALLMNLWFFFFAMLTILSVTLPAQLWDRLKIDQRQIKSPKLNKTRMITGTALLILYATTFFSQNDRFNCRENCSSYSLGTWGLTQYWRMFAPYPNRDDGWFTLEIEKDGELYDLISLTSPAPREADQFRTIKKQSLRRRVLYLQARKYNSPIFYQFLANDVCRTGKQLGKIDSKSYQYQLKKWTEITDINGDELPLESEIVLHGTCSD